VVESLAAKIASLSDTRNNAKPMAGILADTLPPSLPFWQQLRQTAVVRNFVALLATHALETTLVLLAWAAIGKGALSGRLDSGWVIAWGLCLATTIPLKLLTSWLQGTLAIALGGLLKQRLLAGAMTIDADFMKHKGAGQLLSQAMEAESIERSAATGGLSTILALLDLVFVLSIFAYGAAPLLSIAVFLLWLALSLTMAYRNTLVRRAWTQCRLEITHKLVERMTGHRTRLAQQSPVDWHTDEDTESVEYLKLSRQLDKGSAWLSAVMPIGYLIVSFAALTPAFLSAAIPLEKLAISLGGILFSYAALQRLAFGVTRLGSAWISWLMVKPMFEAAGKSREQGITKASMGATETVLDAQDIVFMHQGRNEPTLKGCSLTVKRGDFILLEGGSGGGKSTFASILAGFRQPSSGLVLASGLDWQTLGEEGWRRRIVAAPQYHENHILSASFAFNLLMGRAYPHTRQDLKEAWDLCIDLGLGPLLSRMPSGMETMIGETGWQLSQGERSRVFLGRALLQGGDLVMLDESFAALDPDNMRQCLECVFKRAKTLLVIAHP
jgi:ATP-binding cassette, subfamily B, bacterial